MVTVDTQKVHIINLTVNCKDATGDGTKIVCLNNDYIVKLNVTDCGAFTDAPVKQLIVRHDRDYYEVDIDEMTTGAETFLGAYLPPLERNGYVDLGICGKQSDNKTILYSSKSARYECDKSVLTGVVVLKADPVLKSLDVTENGKYTAVEHDADGFNEVDVHIESKIEESLTIAPDFSAGNQTITPSATNRLINEVTLSKPISLIPENIRKGLNIAGVSGTLEYKTMDKYIFTDGEYTPDLGYDGFSKVTVSVGKSRIDKVLNIHPAIFVNSFEHTYKDTASKASYEINTPGVISCLDDGEKLTFIATSVGNCMVTVDNTDESGNIINTIYYNIYVVNNDKSPIGTLPITSNGTYEVSPYMFAEVQIPKPSAKILGNTLYITNIE